MEQVLVVDDDSQIRDLLRIFLEKLGYKVFEANNGNNALIFCKSIPFDLIITDIFMPGMGGIDFIRNLIGLLPGIKIIAISGGEVCHFFTSTTPLNTAVYSGAIRSLQKPFKLAELHDTIREINSVRQENILAAV